ncbi:PREDICTED: EMBRYO SURROUNDING FACTOR 1-like protein 11 [Tarenaya hassleriana]|uniref:EMBRYO SURROUNDING FACTOR 1-like protein 11 n=1 Tax=Tarenaya hassleriana TaxID=28532 RepID=UPI0008FD4D80|nr:PREDICTED: EMBRYO SURROUNDING FACTOR 1-like protein 11 [Tarenaya hassleriana]
MKSPLAIFCLVLVISLFGLHQCASASAGKNERIDIFVPPCIRGHCSFGLTRDCYCCVGKVKQCWKTKEPCWQTCPKLNPPLAQTPSSIF